MVGRNGVLEIDKKHAKPKEVVLKDDHLTIHNDIGKTMLNDINFTVRRGEILGVAGVEGNGQMELAESISGLRTFNHGDIFINGTSIKGKSVRQIRELGFSHINEDRMTYGVADKASVKNNIMADRYYKKEYLTKAGLLNHKKIDQEVDDLIKKFLVKTENRDEQVKMLSGGNIQKVVVAREFSSNPDIILADQPTRGIDVGATEFIRNQLVALRDEGKAVLLISADLNEVLEVSDSIIVMNNNEIAAYIEDASKLEEYELGEYMLGVKKMSAEEVAKVVHD
jgi:simple sugar transport system ATP-binding protein